jgi:hypothetical protein
VSRRDPGLFARNRPIIAARLGWPDGAVETCEQLELAHPGWRVSWCEASTVTGWEHPGGWRAFAPDEYLVGGDELRRLPEDGVSRVPHVFGATPAALAERIGVLRGRLDELARQDEAISRWMRAGLG